MGLTPREYEVMSRWARGDTVDSIRAELGISRNWVYKHLESVRRKTDASTSRGALVALGWLTIPPYEGAKRASNPRRLGESRGALGAAMTLASSNALEVDS